MQDHRTALTISPEGVLVVSGFAASLRVERGHLLVRSGTGQSIQEAKFSKVNRPKLRRLVVVGRGGWITMEALAWLDGIGAAFEHVSRSGRVLATSARLGLDIPALRRAQALASDTQIGVEISRYLLGLKVSGELSLLTAHLPEAGRERAVIEGARRAIENADSIGELRMVEARAAVAYWSAWADVAVTFARKDQARVPAHWLTFGQRGSMLASGPRIAVTPGNAIANYLFAIGEAECRIALLGIGLDPGLGIVHRDQRARDSMALDLLEAIRPQIEDYLLRLLEEHTFAARDFLELPTGSCRIGPALARTLAGTSAVWAAAVAPVAERLAHLLAQGTSSAGVVPTRLSQDRRSAAKDSIRRAPRRARTVDLPAACRSCGVILQDRGRLHCDDCLPERQAELAAEFVAAGPARLARLRAQGHEPLHRPETKERLRQKRLQRRAEQHAWIPGERDSSDPETFKREILPVLQGVAVRRIAVATGLSLPYCSEVRRGLKVPHPRHWEALRSVLDA